MVVLGLRKSYLRQEVYSEDYPIGDNEDKVSCKLPERGEELLAAVYVEKPLLFARCPFPLRPLSTSL